MMDWLSTWGFLLWLLIGGILGTFNPFLGGGFMLIVWLIFTLSELIRSRGK